MADEKKQGGDKNTAKDAASKGAAESSAAKGTAKKTAAKSSAAKSAAAKSTTKKTAAKSAVKGAAAKTTAKTTAKGAGKTAANPEEQGQAEKIALQPEDEKAYRTYDDFSTLCLFCANMFYVNPTSKSTKALIAHRDIMKKRPFANISPASWELEKILGSAEKEEKETVLFHVIRQDYAYLLENSSVSHTVPVESAYRMEGGLKDTLLKKAEENLEQSKDETPGEGSDAADAPVEEGAEQPEDVQKDNPFRLDVRKYYEDNGLSLSTSESEPDDHIGLEFAFLSELFSRAANAIAAGDKATCDKTIDTAKSFMSDHLLVFAPTFFNNIEAQAHSTFYINIARLASAVLDEMAGTLGVEASEKLSDDLMME